MQSHSAATVSIIMHNHPLPPHTATVCSSNLFSSCPAIGANTARATRATATGTAVTAVTAATAATTVSAILYGNGF